MIGRRDEQAWLQSDFYYIQFHKMLRRLIISVLIIFALILAIIYTILFQPPERYYANTTDGYLLPMPSPIILAREKK